MGWGRAFTYLKHRLLRISDTPENIAKGLAIGLGVSFTPLLGTHFIQAGLLALLMRGNAIAAMIGTFIGNPWTFPFFWWGGFSFGSFLFSFFGIKGAENLPETMSLTTMWELLWTEPWSLFLPWMLGGYILAFLVIPPSYYIYLNFLKAARKAREKAKKMRKKNKIKRPAE